MSTRTMSTWETTDNRGKAVVKFSSIDELFMIDYYDDVGHKFFTEEYPDKSIHYVEDAAYNWSVGIKELEIT